MTFTPDALMLRTTTASGGAYRGYTYDINMPVGTVLECPDWDPSPSCGHGFHGLLDGRGDPSLMKAPGDRDALWWVWEVMRSETVKIDEAKVKVPRMRLLYVGGFGGAMARMSLPIVESITRQIKATTESAKKVKSSHNTGYQGASSNTGYQGASSNTGTRGASSNTGYQGASSNTGDYGASLSVGSHSSSETSGKDSVAVAAGYKNRARGSEGNAVFWVERDSDGKIINTCAAIIGTTPGVKADTWYELIGGNLVEA